VIVLAACNDTNIQFFTAPTVVPHSPVGVQQAVTGLFSASRLDQGTTVLDMAGYGRQAGNFTNSEPRFITYDLGLAAIPTASGGVWAQEFSNISFADAIISAVPLVAPKYATADSNAIVGVVQTIKALNYMYMQELHDTLGGVVYSPSGGVQPAYCNPYMWHYIVALLDSAEANLVAAGTDPLPVILPDGFGAAGSTAGPSTATGGFASFNRALAAKAGLELAYAIARGPGGTPPTPTTPGLPDVTALTRADSAMNASALYTPTALPPNPSGSWAADAHTIVHEFSASSGDQTNPMSGYYNTLQLLKEMTADQDTVNDQRWIAKMVRTPNKAVQQLSYAQVADSTWLYSMYQSPTSSIPIIRSEELTLIEAQIQIGLGNYATAATLTNDVRTEVGGLAPATIPATYVGARDALLKEQQLSTVLEGGGDRAISIRMYNLAVQLDTTWGSQDLHTTILPVPQTELSGRGGSFTTTCPAFP